MSSADRSISSGFPIPQWMKSKINDRYDLDQPTFSPEETDDSFFLVRYLKPDTVNQKRSDNTKNKPAEENLAEKTVQNLKNMPPALIVTETPEFKGHTLACQRFITNTCADAVAAASLGENITDPPKSLGIDDGFKSGASECGKSIVAMAHQMVSGRRAYQGRSSGPQDILVVGPSPSMLSKRRNSKSLPASPISSPPGSPRSMRKNPYFTAPFQEESSGDKHGSSWILSNLFSHRADSQEELSDKESKRFPKPLSSTNLSIKPKPTELREMNFWTPTSM
ncbi:uncharacterized protein LOC132938682 [Metopolophium dirhodum]|uniref:uncharacterized protein LOC132938682 n=1 Tax=Metopolophium dirhodum TaxID=44670 RepID=UPI00298F82E5|nr:uncharacterized protein LOC132938682 [Metopolophium dirhodum]